jgi:tRNA(adenine34) deaminase
MCVGAIIAARFDRVVFGAPDKKAGAVDSTYQLEKTTHFNHYPKIERGVLENECSMILKDFFQELRMFKK